jgi:hypothetical protein
MSTQTLKSTKEGPRREIQPMQLMISPAPVFAFTVNFIAIANNFC